MSEPTLETVLQHLAGLEREARWWKWVGCTSVVILGLVMFLGASGAKVPDEIQARRFVLSDEEGKARATLGMDPEHGWPYLGLYDKDGKRRAQLIVDPNGSSILGLSSANSPDAEAWLVVGADGSAHLRLADKDAAILIMAQKGRTGAIFSGKDAGGLGSLHVSIPAEGQPSRRIALSIIDQGRFVWIAP